LLLSTWMNDDSTVIGVIGAERRGGVVSAAGEIGKRCAGAEIPRSRIQRRTRLALAPLASAMPVTKVPDSSQAAISACLSSSRANASIYR